MKTTKVLGISVAALVVIAIAVGVYIWSSLDTLVEAAIEKYGSQVTQTRVEVAGVKLALTSGEGAIQGIQIGNPAGFSRKHIFTLGNVSVAVDPKTVTDDVVVIDKIIIQAPQIFYEINNKGQSNIDALKKNVQQATSSTGKAQAEGSDAKEAKLIIRKLIIEKGKIDARIAALGDKDMSANLPRIELTDIGKKSGGATPADVAEKVASVLVEKVGPAVADLGVEQYLGKTADEAKAQLKQRAEKVEEKIVKPSVAGLHKEKIDYTGFLYIGIMNVLGNPYVVEYNVRMGDPEAEVVLPRVKSDLLELFIAVGQKKLNKKNIEIDPQTVCTVMLVSGGYPGSYEKGKEIRGLEKESKSVVFHAGTKSEDGKVLTNGGRVLSITSYGEDMVTALARSYNTADQIDFEGKNYRRDIGFDL